MRPAGHLDIGPLRLALRTDGSAPVRYSDPAYAGFFSYPPPGDLVSSEAKVGSTVAPMPNQPLLELAVEIQAGVGRLPAGEPLWRAGGHWAAWEEGGELVFHVGLEAPEESRSSCRVANDLSRAELGLHPSAWKAGVLESPLRYPLDQMLSWGLLSKIGGALLHAAVAVKDGVGYVFAGRSGAGKSTLCALCHAEGWRILNDDRAMVFRRAKEWRVAGTPWHGSGRFAEADEVPLGGVFLLRQAAECRIGPLAAAQAQLALLDVAAVPWFVEAWSQGMLDGLDRLVRDIAPARFHFTKSAAAVDVLAGEAALA